MDMTKYAGSESKYLKAADLGGKAVKVWIESVEIVEFQDDDGSKYQKPCLALRGKEKRVVCNATAVMELGTAYGFDSDLWAGKEIGLSVKHYQSLGKDGIVITAMGKPEKFEDTDSIPF
jgi:hypothetical protein